MLAPVLVYLPDILRSIRGSYLASRRSALQWGSTGWMREVVQELWWLIGNPQWQRDIVVASVTEEAVFRGCLMAALKCVVRKGKDEVGSNNRVV